MRYWDIYPEDISTIEDITTYFKPYKYGYVTEVDIDSDGNNVVYKHMAMGR
jgi:hypothetical protein